MKLNKILLAAFTTFLLAACTQGSDKNKETSESANAAAAAALQAPDDFDSTAVKKEEPKEELPDRYVANSSNEAIELMQSLPDADKYMSGILPRMSRECLDYAMRLLNDNHDGFLIVDKESMQVGLYDKYGREVLRYGIACAKNYGTKHKKGDSRTPEGFFSVEGIYDSTDWLFTDDNGRTSKVKGQFGPRFIRLRIPGTSQIGIHGTRAPGSIGRRASHGCIRVTNDHILELVKHVKPGMPVIVSPSRRDEKVNVNEGVHIPWVSVVAGVSRTEQKPDPKKPEKKEEAAPTDSLATPRPAEPTEPASQPETSPVNEEPAGEVTPEATPNIPQ